MGDTMIDASRSRIRYVMGKAADRCAYLATGVELVRVDPSEADMQRRSVAVLRWAETVFRAWATDNRTLIEQLDASDLEAVLR